MVGFFDDRLQLSPVAKLVASLAVGAFLVFALAGGEPDGALPSSYTLIGTIWFAGLCHAFNLLDNMDGLAAGVALIATAFLAALLGPSLGAGLCHPARRAGRSAGRFLYWNRPRARLFMGDCGSLFIGAILGGVSLVPVFHARDRLRQPERAGGADPRRAALRHRVRARAAPTRGTQRHARRHRSRVASPGVARLLGAHRRSESCTARAHRRADRVDPRTVELHRRADAGRGALRRPRHPDRHLPRPRPGVQRRRLQGAAEVVVRARFSRTSRSSGTWARCCSISF